MAAVREGEGRYLDGPPGGFGRRGQIKPTKISEDISVPRSQIPNIVRKLKAIAGSTA